MAAGLGFKTFTTGEVLTAGDVNGYLMQGINVFATTTARNAAITAPAEGQFAFTKDTNSLWYYDGAAWVASGATGDIEGVTVTSPLTGGGTSGTVTVGILSGTTSNLGAVQLSDSTSSTSTTLAATANAVKTTYDLANGAIPKSIVDAKGDLVAATAADTVSRLGVGANGTVLTADSAEATGLKWVAPASGSTFVGARVYGSAVQSINNATYATVTWNTESYDTDNFHDNTTNSSRLTIPSGKAGKYLFVLKTTFNSSSNTGARILYFFKNGSEVNESEFSLSTRGNLQMCLTTVQNASVGDYFEMIVYQTTGGAIDLDKTAFYSEFSCSYLGA